MAEQVPLLKPYLVEVYELDLGEKKSPVQYHEYATDAKTALEQVEGRLVGCRPRRYVDLLGAIGSHETGGVVA